MNHRNLFLFCSFLFYLFAADVSAQSISGRVTANGAGIGNILVLVYDANAIVVNSVSTAANPPAAIGNYTVDGLPNGSYKVLFYGQDKGYAYQWYNNKGDFNSAAFVSVTAPNNTGGIDAALTTGGSISGIVTDKNQTPLNGIKVCACDPNYFYPNAIEEYVCGYTGADGAYQLSNLPAGTIKVEFYGQDKGYITQWYNNKGDFNSANPVSVTDGTNTPLENAKLYKSGSISGTVKANGAGIENIVVVVYDTNESNLGLTKTKADGTYTVAGLPPANNYKVEFYGQDKGYIIQWYNNKSDFSSANPVSVADGTNTQNIDAVLTTGGSISGTVTAKGSGTANLLVEVYDVNNKDTFVSFINTAADGTYTARGLPTGSYKVKFYGSQKTGYTDQWYNNKGDFNSADTVSVTAPNNTSGINAALNNGGSISGKVTAKANGAGIANVPVVVYDAQNSGVYYSYGFTLADGTYTAGGLRTGSYKVAFYGQSAGYAEQWYNNKSSFNSANTVSVTFPNNTPGINAALNPSVSTTSTTVQPTTSSSTSSIIPTTSIPTTTTTIRPTTTTTTSANSTTTTVLASTTTTSAKSTTTTTTNVNSTTTTTSGGGGGGGGGGTSTTSTGGGGGTTTANPSTTTAPPAGCIITIDPAEIKVDGTTDVTEDINVTIDASGLTEADLEGLEVDFSDACAQYITVNTVNYAITDKKVEGTVNITVKGDAPTSECTLTAKNTSGTINCETKFAITSSAVQECQVKSITPSSVRVGFGIFPRIQKFTFTFNIDVEALGITEDDIKVETANVTVFNAKISGNSITVWSILRGLKPDSTYYFNVGDCGRVSIDTKGFF